MVAATSGGGIYNATDGEVNITNCTFWKNGATGGGGAFYNYSNKAPVFRNSIVWGNELNPGNDANSASIYHLGASPMIINCLVTHSRGSSDWYYAQGVDGGGNLDLDPKFVDAPGGDFRLKITSKAINAGSTFMLPEWDTLDLAGNARIYNSGQGSIDSVVDMVAYEYVGDPIRPDANGILYVDETAGPGGDGSSWASALSTFDAAIYGGQTINATTLISTDSLRQIWVAAGTYQPMAPGYTFFMLPRVKIYGGFAGTEINFADRNLLGGHTSILKGNGNTVVRNYLNGLDSLAILDGFTITGGNTTGRYYTYYGGGIANYSASGKYSHLIITGNNAYGVAGIYNYQSAPIFKDIIVTANTAEICGGIYNDENDGTRGPSFTNMTLTNNTAQTIGGMYNVSSDPSLTNVLIAGNKATVDYGGGLYNFKSSPVLNNVTIAGNFAAGSGGGIYNSTNSVTNLNNCIIWGNTAPQGSQYTNSAGTVGFSYSLYADAPEDIYEENGGVSFSDEHTLHLDPAFMDPTQGNYQLSGTSPAINAGLNSIAVGTTDVAGNPRVFDLNNGGIVDMGAFEYQNLVLSVKMDKLSGYVDKDQHVNLLWTTYTELQNKGFQIMYSSDGIHFKNLGFVASLAPGGNSLTSLNYKQDVGVIQGTGAIYYRLQQINLDGSTWTSNTLRLQSGSSESNGLSIYPNPVHNQLNVQLQGGLQPSGQLILMDMTGKVLRQIRTTAVQKESVKASIQIEVSDLAAGVYILRYIDTKGTQIGSVRFIKK